MRTILVLAGTLFCLPAAALARCGTASEDSGYSVRKIHFSRVVANIEYVSDELTPTQTRIIRALPPKDSGTLWFGRIKRRLPGDPASFSRHDVHFAATYEAGRPVSLWCDQNFNGDLSDDPPLRLYASPVAPGARAGLAELTWSAAAGAESIPIVWTVRLVLEPVGSAAGPPRFRVQMVYGMVGTIPVDGKDLHAFLFDGNHDGLYTGDYGDGIFVDADVDGNVLVDPTADEFLPFGVPSQIGRTRYVMAHVEATGASIMVRYKGEQKPLQRLVVGEPAPDFEFAELDGRLTRLSRYRGHPVVVYFWASWCGACEELAPTLRSMYDRFHPRGLEVLSVSFDHDQERMLSFVARHQEPWPISYLGRRFWENPIGRLYGVSVAGSAYLIDAEGKFAGLYSDLDRLAQEIPPLLRGNAASADSPTGSR